jgi:hypothetical protein
MILKSSISPPPKWVEGFARFGLSAKGVVYCLTGLLAFMAAFHLGNQGGNASKSGLFSFIKEQPFGKILLAIVALGLVSYCVWRFIQAFKDTENKGSDAKGLSIRARYLLSGLTYTMVAIYAIRFLFTSPKKSGGESEAKAAGQLMSQPFGEWLVGLVGLVIIGIGLFQITLALSGKYKKHVEEGHTPVKSRTLILRAGKVGYISRGIVWLIIGWLFIKAAWQSDAKQAGGTNAAFHWIEDSDYGSYLLAAIAIGLICYGIFMFVRARFQPVHG